VARSLAGVGDICTRTHTSLRCLDATVNRTEAADARPEESLSAAVTS
jgi:hypothetical protein